MVGHYCDFCWFCQLSKGTVFFQSEETLEWGFIKKEQAKHVRQNSCFSLVFLIDLQLPSVLHQVNCKCCIKSESQFAACICHMKRESKCIKLQA